MLSETNTCNHFFGSLLNLQNLIIFFKLFKTNFFIKFILFYILRVVLIFEMVVISNTMIDENIKGFCDQIQESLIKRYIDNPRLDPGKSLVLSGFFSQLVYLQIMAPRNNIIRRPKDSI